MPLDGAQVQTSLRGLRKRGLGRYGSLQRQTTGLSTLKGFEDPRSFDEAPQDTEMGDHVLLLLSRSPKGNGVEGLEEVGRKTSYVEDLSRTSRDGEVSSLCVFALMSGLGMARRGMVRQERG